MPKMVTVAEAAEVLGCTKANIYQLIKRRGIEPVKMRVSIDQTYQRKIWVQHIDLEKLQEEQQVKGE